jgi:hypothetical protein
MVTQLVIIHKSAFTFQWRAWFTFFKAIKDTSILSMIK